MASRKKPKTFLAYLLRDKQNLYAFVSVWVVLAAIWVLFPAMADPEDRYGRSVRAIVTFGWPVWLGITYVVYRGWLTAPRRGQKK